MKPLKLTIQGDFWDCQLYRGRLYLWSMDNSIKVYDWNILIDSIIQKGKNKLALYCAFTNSDFLYGKKLKIVFSDDEFKNILQQRFGEISNNELVITESELPKFLIAEQRSPFKELTIDTEIISNKLYAITDYDLWCSNIVNTKVPESRPINVKPDKIWDCQLLSLKGFENSKLALSGGSDGLFRYDLQADLEQDPKLKKVDKNIFQISESHSLFANWVNYSIYNTSNVGSNFLALFKEHTHDDKKLKQKQSAFFSHIVGEKEIFGSNGAVKMSWADKDKVYRVSDGNIEVVAINNSTNIDEERFTKSNIKLHQWKGKTIAGGSAHFGTIVECENAIVVLQSNGETTSIEGSATRWRVYPRSYNYKNHLHVILDDRIEIYSFNQDYFVNQQDKNFGIIYDEKVNPNAEKYAGKW